jgi:C-terminal processing protease CtpA/Prc
MREILNAWNEAAAKRAAAERGRKVPTTEERRKAVQELRRSFQRIERDYSEAYEQCRSDAQRRALEEARQHARKAYLRAENEALIEDREGWRQAESDFNAGKAATARPLAALKTAGAVIRILKRLGRIAEQLAILAS